MLQSMNEAPDHVRWQERVRKEERATAGYALGFQGPKGQRWIPEGEARIKQLLAKWGLPNDGVCKHVLDGLSLEMLTQFEILRPFWYFSVCHVVIPAVLTFYLIKMQAADEKLAVEQRTARQKEIADCAPVVAEDPAPTLFKELIAVNPVAMVWLGACASIPLVAFSMLTPLQSERGRKAQGYVHWIYGPLSILQVFFIWCIFHVRFIDLPRLYLAAAGLLLSVPCFIIWCFCLVCASRYGREDLELVGQQRQERAKAVSSVTTAAANASIQTADNNLVDCTETFRGEWELIYTA